MKNHLDKIKIMPATNLGDSEELDKIFWEVLWKPFGLPRNIRDSFKLESENIELMVKQNSVIVGGLEANFLSPNELELRHIAVKSSFQRKSIGSMLVKKLIEIAKERGCLVIQTYARNTSIDFFSGLGFVSLTGKTLEHPVFSKHGVIFQQMQYVIP
ncbi:MAG: GNAT family N-acetyltransferase [Planctomycetota bacterium]|jgi:N-acetylglutamate synthase-like GNAT family acetyltransferase